MKVKTFNISELNENSVKTTNPDRAVSGVRLLGKNSENFEIGLEANYYSFTIDLPQDREENSCRLAILTASSK